jgi:retinoid hydroxylase
LLGQVHILLVAGHETTTTLNSWLLYFLAQYTDYLQRVHAELDAAIADNAGEVTLKALRSMRLLGNAMDEAGRLRPPVAILPRAALEHFEFGGFKVPSGIQVRLPVPAGHVLSPVFRDPERFDPDRFAPPREESRKNPYALAIFGGGPRICIGMNFAQIKIKAAAAHILREFTLEPMWEKPVAHYYFGLLAAVPTGMHVRVRRRASDSVGI